MENKGQATTVEYRYLGLRFMIPKGWVGREVSAGYLINSHTEPGFAFIKTFSAKTLEEIQGLARQGIQDESGTNLVLTSALEQLNDQSAGGEFEGLFEGTPAKAYIIGLINAQGPGVLIFSGAAARDYGPAHKQVALRLAESMQFFPEETPPLVLQWQQKLQNARLTYMDSYYRNDGGVDLGGMTYGTGGGFSTKIEIHLCEQGFFKYKRNGHTTVDAGGAFGHTAGDNQRSGTWEVAPNAQGEAVLNLHFNNGDDKTYLLEYQDHHAWLNGVRYFLTFGTEGADCSYI